MGERHEEVVPHHTYIYISIITIISTKDPFLLLSNEISLLPLIPSFSFLTVRTDFLTIIKHRKKDINKIARLIEIPSKRLEPFILILSDNNFKQKRRSIRQF